MEPTPIPTLESELVTGHFSEEEKVQIQKQIEAAASSHGLAVDVDSFRPRKRGILFPILVNLTAVLLVAGAWFGANAYFQTRQEGLQLKTDKIFSTESKLLAKVLEDSKNQLAAKNAEIDRIQGEMDQLVAEKANLQKSFENRVADREKALRREMADVLAVERKRLQDAGYGATEVARRLKEFEAQKNIEFNDRLDAYRRQVQGEIDQRSQAVVALQAKLQASVTEQESLRKEIEKQTKERERDLQSQLSSQATDIESLKREREDLNQFYRQADAAMAAVRAAFDSGDLAKTQAAVLALRQVLAKAGASASEVVRARAQGEGALVSTLDTAVAGLEAASDRTATNAQVDAIKAQAKKEQDLAALQLKETQQTLADTEVRWRQAADEAETLRRALDEAVLKLGDNRTEAEALGTQVADLQKAVQDLVPYRVRFQTLQTLFTRDYPTARERFLATLGSAEGQQQFPGFDPAWQQMVSQFREEGTADQVRRQALDDVLTFTDYLQGLPGAGQAARDTTEKLSRTDPTYKKVVDSIQTLVATGAAEAAVKTTRTQLYGSVASFSRSKVVLEPLTKVRPTEGQSIEIRRVQGKKETVLGVGTVVSATNQRVEVDWGTNDSAPLSGDPAYLVLP